MDRAIEVADILMDTPFPTVARALEIWLYRVYPPNVFTGASGDPGAVFVVRLREALRELAECPECRAGGEMDG